MSASGEHICVGEKILNDKQGTAMIDAAIVNIEKYALEQVDDEHNTHNPNEAGG